MFPACLFVVVVVVVLAPCSRCMLDAVVNRGFGVGLRTICGVPKCWRTPVSVSMNVAHKSKVRVPFGIIVQELCESRGGRPGLSVLTNLLVSVDVKL